MYCDDKENIRYHPNERKDSSNGIIKPAGSKRASFMSMADEINKEMTTVADSKLAMKAQCKDISDMVEKICNDYERDDEGTSHCFACLYVDNYLCY